MVGKLTTIDEGDVEVRGASVTTVDRSDEGLSREQTVMPEHLVELYKQSVSHLSDDADKKLLADLSRRIFQGYG